MTYERAIQEWVMTYECAIQEWVITYECVIQEGYKSESLHMNVSYKNESWHVNVRYTNKSCHMNVQYKNESWHMNMWYKSESAKSESWLILVSHIHIWRLILVPHIHMSWTDHSLITNSDHSFVTNSYVTNSYHRCSTSRCAAASISRVMSHATESCHVTWLILLSQTHMSRTHITGTQLRAAPPQVSRESCHTRLSHVMWHDSFFCHKLICHELISQAPNCVLRRRKYLVSHVTRDWVMSCDMTHSFVTNSYVTNSYHRHPTPCCAAASISWVMSHVTESCHVTWLILLSRTYMSRTHITDAQLRAALPQVFRESCHTWHDSFLDHELICHELISQAPNFALRRRKYLVSSANLRSVCCSVLQFVAVCCHVLQCVAVCWHTNRDLQKRPELQVCCSVM